MSCDSPTLVPGSAAALASIKAKRAFNLQLNQNWHDSLEPLPSFPEGSRHRPCRAVVLIGAGGTFCAGVDLRDPLFADASLMTEEAFNGPKNYFWQLRQVKVPLIAAVAGACITGGMELALNCDIIIASDTAFFQDTHTRYGIVPGAGMTSILPKSIGLHAAKWMSLTGTRIPAQRAHELGLVAKV